ncbi:MAG TPA: hypothetical protein VJO53_08955 [Candidatus Acidoferrales bacterium]|nr:hypothetical protein [Candidatus Acidoferrales bacterium]
MSQQKKPRKIGRPALPKGRAKARIVPVRFSADDLKTITAAAKARKQNLSEWIRTTLMGGNIKRWYAFCPDELHIPLFENRPRKQDYCLGCGGIKELHGIGEGYVSKEEADKGRADSRPLDNPNSTMAPRSL